MAALKNQMQSMLPSADEDTRSTKEFLQHPLETVPYFQRPMGSSTDDPQVGQDDAGNPVFKGRFGEYTVKVNPDQRTLRTKVEEAIPVVKEAVGEYLEDPKLPTKDQLSEFAKQAGQSAVESVEDLGDLMFKGKGTLGDVFAVAAGAGAASVPFDVPKGALRIFGGVNAEGAYEDKNLKKAVRLLREADVDPTNVQESYFKNKEIWEQTGWYVDPKDGQWRFEIDDSKSKLKDFKDVFNTKLEPTSPAINSEKSKNFFNELGNVELSKEDGKYKKLSQVFDHKDFYKNYPDLKDIDVIFYSDPKQRTLLGSASDDEIFINLSAYDNYEDIKSTLLHELQHVVQHEEGFVPGSSQTAVPGELLETKTKELEEKKRPLVIKEAVLKKELESPVEGEEKLNLIKKLIKVSNEIYAIDEENFKSEYEFYKGAGGEIESRLVQRRADLSGDERGPQNIAGGFPLDDRVDMLKEEGGKFQYTGSAGVDPYAYQMSPRVEPDPEKPGFLSGVKKKLGLTSDSAVDRPKEKIRYRDDIDPKVYDAFEELADIQRGKPELAMVEAQNILSGGVLPYALEHTGDLTHRMAEKGGVYGSEYVTPKVDRLLDSLLSEYGFEKEMSENIASNARFKYENEKPNISFEQYEKEYQEAVNQALKKYAEEHKKVPVYNEMQLAGREAAVALGEGRYTDAAENLYKIKMALNDKNYAEKSMQFNPEIDFRNKPKDFNKGGAVMNEQMEMAFMQEGGLKDDGMRQDPVSGNEVPSGSMASEVRDDIPAQLSEGEYVVPADVVRFFGVKFFEDLRMEAKMGLQSMEANGRIGGEPVAAPQEGTLSDEEFAMLLQKELQMAEGGMVPEMDQTMGTPAPIKAAEGKYIPGQMPIFNPRAFGLGFSMTPGYTPPPVAGTEPIVETEASCAARGLVLGPDGMCIVPLTPQARDDDSIVPEDEGEDSTTWMDSYDYTDFDNLAQQTSAALDGPTSIIGGVAELLLGGGVLGKFAKASNAAQVAANIAVLKAQGQDVSALTGKFNSYIKDNNLTQFKNFITGKELAKQINATQIDVPLGLDSTDVFGNKIFKDKAEFNKQMEKVAPKGMTYQPGKDDNDTGAYVRTGSAAPSSSPRPKGGFAAAKAAAKAASNKDSGPSGAAKKSSPSSTYIKSTSGTSAQKARESSQYGALNKGGLMKKKRKK